MFVWLAVPLPEKVRRPLIGALRVEAANLPNAMGVYAMGDAKL